MNSFDGFEVVLSFKALPTPLETQMKPDFVLVLVGQSLSKECVRSSLGIRPLFRFNLCTHFLSI